jgi:membrane-bound lytic murein transglycosylase A
MRSLRMTTSARSTGAQQPRAGRRLALGAALAAAVLSGCQSVPPPPPPPAPPTAAPPAIKTITTARYERADATRLPALTDADLLAAWPAWLASCRAFERSPARRALWQPACAAGAGVPRDAAAIRRFFNSQFEAWALRAESREDPAASNGAAANGAQPRVLNVADRGRITGYYEPLLAGSRQRSARFAVPLHRRPDDLLIVDLGSLYPELAGKRVRGRLVDSPGGKRVVPYPSRAELAAGLAGHELLWVDDAIEAFFLQIQGSGRVQFADGSQVRVGYADTNGHAYRSIGRVLIDRGELTFEQASMQGIQAWARANPARLQALLDENPSYIFFRELPLGDPATGPLGALNVPLTPGYSLAADPQFVPLGAPVLIDTVHPSNATPLRRLALAQDTGGAIRGPIRFDFFWGFGREVGEHAGRQRHDVTAWVLLPKGVTPEAALAAR